MATTVGTAHISDSFVRGAAVGLNMIRSPDDRTLWLSDLHWTWGDKHSFQERADLKTASNNPENIKVLVKNFVEGKARRYCYDCGHLEYPMHPRIISVEVIPIGESVIHWDESVLQNHLFREFEAECLKAGKVPAC